MIVWQSLHDLPFFYNILIPSVPSVPSVTTQAHTLSLSTVRMWVGEAVHFKTVSFVNNIPNALRVYKICTDRINFKQAATNLQKLSKAEEGINQVRVYALALANNYWQSDARSCLSCQEKCSFPFRLTVLRITHCTEDAFDVECLSVRMQWKLAKSKFAEIHFIWRK